MNNDIIDDLGIPFVVFCIVAAIVIIALSK